MTNFVIVGGGVFGFTAAVELSSRGHQVTVLDPGPLPHPLAASTDLNKAVRMEYGADLQYTQMVDQAIDGWLEWNERFKVNVYEPTGVLMLTKKPMAPGGYEYESLKLIDAQGRAPERLDGDTIHDRFGAWRAGVYAQAAFQPRGGYTRSGLTVEKLCEWAIQLGVHVRPGITTTHTLETSGKVTGVLTTSGETIRADHTIIAAGAWTPDLVPEIRPYIQATAHPMFYLRPSDPAAYTAPNFCVFTADVANTGWYGFPVDPDTGLWKIAKHDSGHTVAPDHDRGDVSEDRIRELRDFLQLSLPGLAEAPLVKARNCFYTDTLDGHLWIDRHPQKTGLTLATGGSGHAMKMAPVLGGLIADAAEGKAHPWLERFCWRTKASSVPADAARAKR